MYVRACTRGARRIARPIASPPLPSQRGNRARGRPYAPTRDHGHPGSWPAVVRAQRLDDNRRSTLAGLFARRRSSNRPTAKDDADEGTRRKAHVRRENLELGQPKKCLRWRRRAAFGIRALLHYGKHTVTVTGTTSAKRWRKKRRHVCPYVCSK